MAEQKITKGEINDLFLHLFDRKSRKLFPSIYGGLRLLIEKVSPEKLNISTLKEVFEAFYSQWKINVEVVAVYFAYDERRWKATIKREDSIYNNKLVHFTNIKLPNDGFFYSEKYSEGGGEFAKTEETEAFVLDLIKKLPINFEIGEVEVKYFEDEQRFAIYVWSQGKDQCFTVKFENEFHCHAVKQEQNKWKNVLESKQ